MSSLGTIRNRNKNISHVIRSVSIGEIRLIKNTLLDHPFKFRADLIKFIIDAAIEKLNQIELE